MSYSLDMYGRMIQDEVRRNAWCEALRRLVREDSVVLDVGAGFGYFGVFAATLGAKRVVAVETSAFIRLGEAFARENGVSDRIEFVEGRSQDLDLPGGADIVLADLNGSTPYFRDHFSTLADLQRFLRPGAAFLPEGQRLLAAGLGDVPELDRLAHRWDSNELTMQSIADCALNMVLASPRPEDLLTPSQVLCDLVPTDPEIARHTLTTGWKSVATRTSTIRGIGLWMEYDVFEEIGYSTSSASEPHAWVHGNQCLALRPGLRVDSGDSVAFRVACTSVSGEWFWSWSARNEATGQRIDSSSLHSVPLDGATLRRAEDPSG